MRVPAVLPLILLAACSSLYDYEPASYLVRQGDTLYSIAWRHGVDHRDLAAWNGLSDPDRIFVGQRLVLAGSSVRAASGAPASAPARPASSPAPVARPAASMPLWQWPVTGTVVARFGERGALSTGIAIAGSLGQDIEAAAPGEVVYVGSGLPEYGQLVIVRHSETWLSAYGHNQRVLVAEDELVARGQKIAEMGRGPGGQARLHFEIRRNGDALDPLGLLPSGG